MQMTYFSWGQNQDFLASRLEVLAKNKAPDLAYVQTSKGIYENGEDLWFKTYLLNANTFLPSILDKTLYVQLFEEDNKQAVWQEKYEIENGFVNGHIFLHDSLRVGTYLLKVFSEHSFYNDSSSFSASRRIIVRSNVKPQMLIAFEFDKQFYSYEDSIELEVNILSEQKSPLLKAVIEAELWNGETRLELKDAKTDKYGKVKIQFDSKVDEGLKIKILARYEDKEEVLEKAVPIVKAKKDQIEFTCFPEGGYLIYGIKAKVAFKAMDSEGRPVDVTGTIFEDNKPLLKFASEHYGMGSFVFRPLRSKDYRIELLDSLHSMTYRLPEILDRGLAMQLIDKTEDDLVVKVSNTFAENKKIYLRVQIRGKVFGMAMAEVEKELLMRVPIKVYPQGIAEITLFNEEWEPIAERLVYLHEDRKLNIEIQNLEETYATRGKGHLKIKVTDEFGRPVVAQLGASIYDKIYQNMDDPNTILNHFYLSSQLKGSIYDPSYYFNTKNRDRGKALDLLMLTQGWRKYVWEEKYLNETIGNGRPVIFDEINGIVSVDKKNRKKDAIVTDYFIRATTANNENFGEFVKTDSLGAFTLSTGILKIGEGSYIYLKPMETPGSNFKPSISLDQPFETLNAVMPSKKMFYPVAKPTIEKKEVESFMVERNTTLLDEVIVTDKKQSTIRGKLMGSLTAPIDNSMRNDYVCGIGVLNCKNHKGAKGIPQLGMTYLYEARIGKYITITYSEFLAGNFPRSDREEKVYTEEEILKFNNVWKVKGYYLNKEFYSPKYDRENVDDPFPDYRNTLLWEPSLITDVKGEAILEFFCSDVNSYFMGNIEGVGGAGLLGQQSFEFFVRKR